MATTHDPLATGNGGSVKERISEAASQLKDTAGEYGRSAAGHIDRNVHNAADAVESTAEKLRSSAPADSGKVSEMAQSAAGKLDSTAQAMRGFDTLGLMTQLENWTRQNPGLALGGAAAIGFFIGMTLRRDSHD